MVTFPAAGLPVREEALPGASGARRDHAGSAVRVYADGREARRAGRWRGLQQRRIAPMLHRTRGDFRYA